MIKKASKRKMMGGGGGGGSVNVKIKKKEISQ